MGAPRQPKRIQDRHDVHKWGQDAASGSVLMAQRRWHFYLAQEKGEPRFGTFGRRPLLSELAKSQVYAGKRMSKDSRYAMLIDGRLKIEDLTDEELIRGQLMNKNGRFAGQAPKWVPAQFVQALQRQRIQRAADKWNSNLLLAQDQLIALGMDQRVEAGVRMRALTYVIERSIGKVPDKVEMTGAIKPYEELLNGTVEVVRDVDIVDAEVVPDGKETGD